MFGNHNTYNWLIQNCTDHSARSELILDEVSTHSRLLLTTETIIDTMQTGDSSLESADRGGADASSSHLARYLGEIGDVRVLARGEEHEMARRFGTCRARVHELLASLPATGTLGPLRISPAP